MSASISKFILYALLFVCIISAPFQIVGGFSDTSIQEATDKPGFSQSDSAVRAQFYNTYHVNLGQITSVQSQVVAGMNYIINYDSPKGPVTAKVWSKLNNGGV